MGFVRFLKNLWRQQPELLPEALDEGRARPEIERPRIHRKMLLVVHYLESLRKRNPGLAFRYVGPNEMNGQAEELQVFDSNAVEGRSLSIRYLDSLGVYFIEDPGGGRSFQTDEGRVLSSLADVLTAVFPEDGRPNLPSA